jgi:hypothetical protein
LVKPGTAGHLAVIADSVRNPGILQRPMDAGSSPA